MFLSEASRLRLEKLTPEALVRVRDASFKRLGIFWLRTVRQVHTRRLKSPTGTMRRSWSLNIKGPVITFFNAARSKDGKFYANFQERGTGVFGPSRRRITPKAGGSGVLSWIPKGPLSAFKVSPATEGGRASSRVFFRSVKGTKPKKVMAISLRLTFSVLDDIVTQEINKELGGGGGAQAVAV